MFKILFVSILVLAGGCNLVPSLTVEAEVKGKKVNYEKKDGHRDVKITESEEE